MPVEKRVLLKHPERTPLLFVCERTAKVGEQRHKYEVRSKKFTGSKTHIKPGRTSSS